MMQACSVAGCHERTEGGPCSVHRREANRARGSASQRGYDIAWRRLRAAFLKARCEACGEDPNGNCEQCRGTGLANRFCADCLRAGLMVLAEEVPSHREYPPTAGPASGVVEPDGLVRPVPRHPHPE